MYKANIGLPGVQAERIARHRNVSGDGVKRFAPAGAIIDGTRTRDPNNDDTREIRAGTLMGRVTASGRYANSFFGSTQAALATQGLTSLTLTAAEATELVRRQGSSGTFSLTGPPTAAGVVRTSTVTYSSVNTSTGVVTLTSAISANEVHRVDFVTAGTAGNTRLVVSKPDGTRVLTNLSAWSATDATFLSNLQTALDAATGVVNGIVASAIPAVDTDLGFLLTYSGTGYAGQTWQTADVHTTPTSVTTATVTRTVTGVDGRFVAGSLVGALDGSQIPISFIGDGWGEYVAPDQNGGNQDIPWSYVPIEAKIDGSRLLPWSADTSLRQWVRDRLRSASGLFTFVEQYTG